MSGWELIFFIGVFVCMGFGLGWWTNDAFRIIFGDNND